MEPLLHGTFKASKFEPIDFISKMPENVITNILDRLPFQEAVGTSILSKNWRFSWTTLTQLVFDYMFFEYLESKNRIQLFYRKNLYQILLQHKGSLTKFVLYIPWLDEVGIKKKKIDKVYAEITEDLNHWIRCLSTKSLKEFVLINMHYKPLKLSNHIFSCLELKHLHLSNCCLHFVPGWHGFQNLLRFNFEYVRFEGCRYGEFITCCPLLESLKYCSCDYEELKLVEIGRLKNLKQLVLAFCVLEDEMITSSDFFRCMSFLTKLEELNLEFDKSVSLVEEVGVRKISSATWPSLRTLTLTRRLLSHQTLLHCACGLINGSPNLQTLYIDFEEEEEEEDDDDDSLEVDIDIRGLQQLRHVTLGGIRGLKIEVCFIKSLLASSPILERMVISTNDLVENGDWRTFSKKLLKLQRAYPIAEIDFN